jgi:hypothetical protein
VRGDRHPSLLVQHGESGLLVHCYRGCDAHDVLAALRRRGLVPEESRWCPRRDFRAQQPMAHNPVAIEAPTQIIERLLSPLPQHRAARTAIGALRLALSSRSPCHADDSQRRRFARLAVSTPQKARHQQRFKARKTASLIPFPAARQRAFIVKHALRMAKLSPAQSEAYLRHVLQLQGQTMRRRGSSEAVVARELRRLEAAFRAELWRQILTPVGAS